MERYMYSVFTTLLGMSVVFLFLGFLSGLMVFLKKFFSDRINVQPDVVSEKDIKVAETVKEEKKLDWVIAAVAAYLSVEEEELFPHSAKGWQPVANEKYDPWVIGGKLLQRWSGD